MTGVLLLGVLLAGCSPTTTGPGPTPLPTVESPEPSPTPAPTAVEAPVRPPEMERADEVGAVAAAEYFMQLYSFVMRTGDLAEWLKVGAGDCGFCSNIRDEVDRVYGTGGRFAGGGLTVDSAEVLGYDAVLDGYGVGVNYAIASGAEIDSEGDTVAPKLKATGLAIVDVTHSTGEWVLAGFSLRDEDSQ